MDNKCKICIFYHIAERERDGCLMIANSIKRLNSEAEVIVEEFYQGIYHALLYKPDVILTIPPRDANSSNRLTIVKKITNCAILSLLTEGYYGDFPQERIQGAVGLNKYSPYLVDKYLFWGDKTKECFVNVLEKNKKILDKRRAQTVGYIYYDVEEVRDFFKERELPKEVLKWKDGFRKKILVLTGFLTAETTEEEVITMSGFLHYGIKDEEKEYVKELEEWRKRRERFIDYRKKYLNCVIKLAEKNPDIGILVKMHPAEMEQYSEGIKFRCYQKLEQFKNVTLLKENILLGRIISFADVMVHYGSTAGLEAYLYNIPTIQIYDSMCPVKACEPGFCNYESTAKIDANEPELFEKIASDQIMPRYLKDVEDVLKEQFNWTSGKKTQYHPVEAYAEILLDSVGKGQRLGDDKFYRIALQSGQGWDIKRYCIEQVVNQLFKGGKCKDLVEHYQKILEELNISLHEYIVIGLHIAASKVKRLLMKG